MENSNLLGLFNKKEKQKIEEIACDMGLTVDDTICALAIAEIDKNPMLIGANSPESDRTAKIISFNRVRH